MMGDAEYVHGYTEREARRLQDQASTLAEILHQDTRYPAGSTVLEAGCGVGAQTIFLATNSPSARITSVDLSAGSLEQAAALLSGAGLDNVVFRQADVFDLQFEGSSFDHVFICFLLEHLPDPIAALARLKDVLRDGGSITVIEGDHGSCFFHPDSACAHAAIQCLIDAQAHLGGDALIGRRLYPLLEEAGFKDIRVSPRMVYVDSSRPALVEGFTRNTFTAMVEGTRETALELGLATPEELDRGIRDLYRTTEPDGTFCYTFFKATARK
jgi:SAM-dependent methyltransferase